MKILFVAPRFHTNQVNWVNALLENDHNVVFHCLFQGFTENYGNLKPNIYKPCLLSRIIDKVIGSGGVNNPRGFPDPINYYRAFINLKPDVVVVRDISRWFSILVASLGRITGSQVIIYSQTELYKSYGTFRWLVTRIILIMFNAKWMTPIKGDKSTHQRHPKGMYFVPFAVDIEKIDHESNKSFFDLLSIGKFEERKNHLMLLEVFQKLLDNNFPVRLTLIGEVSKEIHEEKLRICKSFINQNNLNDNVKILVNLDHSDISQYYKTSDIFILAATQEPASISVLEAIGLGTPTLCSNTNGTRYYLLENDFGLTFKDNNAENLYIQICKLLNQENLKNYQFRIKENNKNFLSKEVFYDSFMNLLNNK